MTSNCLKIIRKRKAVGSSSKEKVAGRVTVTLLMHCPYLVSHQDAALYCFGVILDSLSFMELRDGLRSSVTRACDGRVTLDTYVPLMANGRTQPQNSDLLYMQAPECQEWKSLWTQCAEELYSLAVNSSFCKRLAVIKDWNLLLLMISLPLFCATPRGLNKSCFSCQAFS